MTPAVTIHRELVGTIPPGSSPTRVSACSDGESVWVEVRRGSGAPQQFSPDRARAMSELLFRAAQAAEGLRDEGVR